MTQLTVKTHSSVTEAPTMTSLEMVDYINADRKAKAEAEGMGFPCKSYRKLEHRSFMKKVPKVLGEAAEKFFSVDTFINGTGGKVERDIYQKQEKYNVQI